MQCVTVEFTHKRYDNEWGLAEYVEKHDGNSHIDASQFSLTQRLRCGRTIETGRRFFATLLAYGTIDGYLIDIDTGIVVVFAGRHTSAVHAANNHTIFCVTGAALTVCNVRRVLLLLIWINIHFCFGVGGRRRSITVSSAVVVENSGLGAASMD